MFWFAVLLACFVTAAWGQRPLKFRGEVKRGESYGHAIGHGLVFTLSGSDEGWQLDIDAGEPRSGVGFASEITPPLRGRTELCLSTDYGTRAQDVAPKGAKVEFRFVLRLDDLAREEHWREILMWPYTFSEKEKQDALYNWGSTAGGYGVFRILDSKVIPGGDSDLGRIEWIKFEVTITFPRKGH